MHSKDRLAAELRKAGLIDMAERAAAGYYHDYLSPLDEPAMMLDAELFIAASPEAKALRARHHAGEFDATKEESDAWAASAEGQTAFRRLLNDD
jgi:hypothetical protein